MKSGLVAGLASSIPDARRDPTLAALTAAAFAGDTTSVRPWAAARSSISKLGSVTTPVFMAQGRRDFLFGIDQGTRAFQRLKGPKVLYVGLHGHAPSTFPAADTRLPDDEGARMVRLLPPSDGLRRCASLASYVAPENFAGQVARRGTLPPVSPTFVSFPGVTTFARSGKAVRTSAPLRKAIEIYGAPTVQTTIAASGGWSRLVAVLTARTQAGKEIVVERGRGPDDERSAARSRSSS